MTKTQTTILRELEALTATFNATYENGESELANAQEISDALQKVRVLLLNNAK
jgi:hypothetical protein